MLNLGLDAVEDTLNISKFYCGDWKSFVDKMQGNNIKFDYIFTSETIYNTNNYKKLHTVFKKCLNDNGTVYLCNVYNNYYFYSI